MVFHILESLVPFRSAGIPTEFVDEQRTILKINSHQLLESSLVDQTEQIEVGKAPFKTVTESDEGRKVLPESNVKNTTIESEEVRCHRIFFPKHCDVMSTKAASSMTRDIFAASHGH